MLIERRDVLNTGDTKGDLTAPNDHGFKNCFIFINWIR